MFFVSPYFSVVVVVDGNFNQARIISSIRNGFGSKFLFCSAISNAVEIDNIMSNVYAYMYQSAHTLSLVDGPSDPLRTIAIAIV